MSSFSAPIAVIVGKSSGGGADADSTCCKSHQKKKQMRLQRTNTSSATRRRNHTESEILKLSLNCCIFPTRSSFMKKKIQSSSPTGSMSYPERRVGWDTPPPDQVLLPRPPLSHHLKRDDVPKDRSSSPKRACVCRLLRPISACGDQARFCALGPSDSNLHSSPLSAWLESTFLFIVFITNGSCEPADNPAESWYIHTPRR